MKSVEEIREEIAGAILWGSTHLKPRRVIVDAILSIEVGGEVIEENGMKPVITCPKTIRDLLEGK